MLVNARLNMSHLPPLSIGMNQRVFAVPTLTLFNMRVRWCSFVVSHHRNHYYQGHQSARPPKTSLESTVINKTNKYMNFY